MAEHSAIEEGAIERMRSGLSEVTSGGEGRRGGRERERALGLARLWIRGGSSYSRQRRGTEQLMRFIPGKGAMERRPSNSASLPKVRLDRGRWIGSVVGFCPFTSEESRTFR
ncbi:hypothetical protein NL676_031558 [Syzygium grande]|nr:hypothetical protein NL676_031558 [Syzygium grande]